MLREIQQDTQRESDKRGDREGERHGVKEKEILKLTGGGRQTKKYRKGEKLRGGGMCVLRCSDF